MPARHILLGARSAPPRLPPTAKFSRMSDLRQPDRKKTGGGHFGVEPHAHDMQNRAKKRASCSTCHAKKQQAVPHVAKKQAVPHVMQKTSCSTCHAKTMQKTSCSTCCKNHAKNKLFHMLHVLYVLYLTRQPTEHPLSPGSLLYVLYVLYLTRQPTEHPLFPGSLLYVLYVLYGPI